MTEDKKFKRLVRARAARTGESYSTSLRHLRARKSEERQVTTSDPTGLEDLKCSFCGKEPKDVKKLIAGPAGVAICDECVDLCVDIISDESADGAKPSEEQLAAAWAGLLKNKARTAQAIEADLAKAVRQARAKGVEWPAIAKSLDISVADAEARYGLPE